MWDFSFDQVLAKRTNLKKPKIEPYCNDTTGQNTILDNVND